MNLDNDKPFIWRKKYEEMGLKLDDKEIEAEARKMIEKNKIELHKIKERQRQRDLEYQQKIQDEEFMQRQKEAQHHDEYASKEDSFILGQLRLKSKIRIRDGRAKSVDLLSYYIELFGAEYEERRIDEAIDLSESAPELLNPCEYLEGCDNLQELEEDVKEYLKADCDENKLFWEDVLDVTDQLKHKGDCEPEVLEQIMNLFENKSIPELDDIEDEMAQCADSNDPSVDADFYKQALLQLRAYRAKLRLKMNHDRNMEEYKDKIVSVKKEKQIIKEEKIVEPQEEMIAVHESNDTRKPRFSNRVETGFEWNKYNQTHYEIDNPPPKFVQGYKFNIYYPDLIDRSKAPTFSIKPCEDDKDFCIIRFSASPPYEDIAFKIVNREWNNSHKSGYKCQFSNQTLQLWFKFKRYRYRR